MKKIFTLVCLAVAAGSFAQSFSVYKTNNSGVITATINNNGGYVENTVAGTVAHPSAAIEDHLLIKNTSSPAMRWRRAKISAATVV